MKFDAERLVSLTESFNQPRAADSPLSAHAGELFETLMRDQGLATVHSDSAPRKRLMGRLFLSALLLTSFLLTWRVLFPTGYIVLCVSAIYYVAVQLLFRLSAEPPSIIASATDQDRATSVVILTALTTPMRRSTGRLRKFFMIPSLGLGFLTLIPVVGSALQHSRLMSGIFEGVHIFCVIMFGWFGSPFRKPKAYNGDNRTGIAMLVELARCWPPSVASRMDAIFVLSASGSRISITSNGRPTLLITLDAPGVGPTNTIVGGEFAEKTVRDLWLPDRYWFGLGGTGVEEVTIQGKHDDSPIDQAALERAAQLINELSLRWAKQHA